MMATLGPVACRGQAGTAVKGEGVPVLTLPDKTERDVFISVLCAAARAGESEGCVDAAMALVVLGMRPDFYGVWVSTPVVLTRDSNNSIGQFWAAEGSRPS